MKHKNEKVEKFRQILIDKLYYNQYSGGLLLEIDNPFLMLPRLTLFYNINDMEPIIPESYKNKIVLDHLDSITGEGVTIIKPIKNDINTEDEFVKLQTEFLDLLSELANDLPENPVWTKFTFPSDKSTKISCTTIN